MRNVWTVAINDMRIFLSDRGNLVGLLVLPLIMTFILGAAFSGSGGATRLRVDVIDLDKSERSQQFLDDLRATNSTLMLCPMDQSDEANCRLDEIEGWQEGAALTLEQATERVSDGITSALVVIPAGFGADVAAFQPVSLEYYSLANILTGDAILQSIQAVLQRVNSAVVAARVSVGLGDVLTGPGGDGTIFMDDADRARFSQAVYSRAAALWDDEPVTIEYRLSGTGEVDTSLGRQQAFGQSVPGMATMFVMFTVLGGMALLLRERKQWTLQRLAVMPLRRAEILGGKILGRFALGILQFIIVFAVGVVIGLDFGDDPVAMLVIILTYTLAITAIGMIFASFVQTELQAGGLTNLIAIVFAGLGGAWWPLSIVPEFMRVIGHVTPVAWAMDSFNAVIFNNAGLSDILVNIAVLLVIALIGFGVGIATFKYD